MEKTEKILEGLRQPIWSVLQIDLRDYFAAAALTGIISHSYENGIDCANYVEFSEYAYKYADAMLAAKEEREIK